MRDASARWFWRTRIAHQVGAVRGGRGSRRGEVSCGLLASEIRVMVSRWRSMWWKNKTVQIVNKQSYGCKFWLQIRILHENMVQVSHCEYPNVCTPLT